MGKRLLVSAVEPSGDRLAAALVRALRARVQVEVEGVAGPGMRAEGVRALARSEDVSVMGIAEVIQRVGAVRAARRAMVAAIDALPPGSALVTVDGPDFHLPLARRAKARGIATIGYVSPQVWAWRPGRARAVAAAFDRLMCLFAFEPGCYAGTGLDAVFTGHPLVDRLRPRAGADPFRFALLPGSRPQEVRRMLPLFLRVAARLREAVPGSRFVAVLPEGAAAALPAWVEREAEIEAAGNARAALSKSGTVTLELAAMGVPMVVAHRAHPLTWLLGRLLVRGVRHLAMPNVLADRAGRSAPVPEHLQWLDPDAIARDLLALPERQPIDLGALGPPGASDRAAEAVLQTWGRRG